MREVGAAQLVGFLVVKPVHPVPIQVLDLTRVLALITLLVVGDILVDSKTAVITS